MSRVYKYQVPTQGGERVLMPKGAAILRTAAQGDQIFVWALVNPAAEPEPRRIVAFPTGADVPSPAAYIGSGEMYDDVIVFHVFELLT